MTMKQFKFRSITCGLLGALLLLGTAAPLTFTACENEHPEISITLTSDYSGIIEAINNANKSLADKLALIEAAVKNGNVSSGQSFDLIIEAINSLTGSLESKLAAIESAIKNQTTSLESKLALIEAALKIGFTDEKTALGQIKTALESLKGSVDGLDGAIDDVVAAIDKVTLAVDGTNTALTGNVTKALDDIFKAIDGLTDYSDILEAIKTAIENIEVSGEGGDDSGDDGTVVLKLTPLDIHGNPVDIIIPWNPKYSDNIKDTLIAKILVEGDRMKLVGPDETNTWNAETNTDYSEGIGAITNHTNHSQCIDVCLVSAARYGESDSTYVYCIRKYDAKEDVTYEGRFNYVVKARPAVAPGTINGYAYVEMGDGLKWATMNVGATKPEEYGDYFAWGETATKTDYSWSTYFDTSDGGSNFTKYALDKKKVLDLEDDAARKNWKGTWRTPTDADWMALRDEANFKWDWTDDYEGTGIAGGIVTSKVEGYAGNTIFLPAAGYRYGTSLYYAGSYGYYWSSSLGEDLSDRARRVFFDSEEVGRDDFYRYLGFSVRPVSE